MTGVTGPSHWQRRFRPKRTTLFRKYAGVLGVLVVTALLVNGGVGTWLFYEEHRTSLIERQEEQARMAADSLGQFLRGLEDDIGWVVQLPWAGTSPDQRRLDALRLLGQASAVTEVAIFDPSGHEWERVSRVSLDILDGDRDLSWDPRFTQSRATDATTAPSTSAGNPSHSSASRWPGDGRTRGWRSRNQSQIHLGSDDAYLGRGTGHRLPRRRDGAADRASRYQPGPAPQRPQRIGPGPGRAPAGDAHAGPDLHRMGGQQVVVASASVPRTDWKILVEVPVSEVFAPVNRSLLLSALLLLVTLAVFAVVGWRSPGAWWCRCGCWKSAPRGSRRAT